MFKKIFLGVTLCLVMIFAVAAPVFAQGGLQETASAAQYKESNVFSLVTGIISLILAFVGIVFLAIMFYAGLRWLIARGNEEFVTRAKDAMLNATIGLILVIAAYGITTLVIRLITK